MSLAEEMESQGTKAWRLGSPAATPAAAQPTGSIATTGGFLIQAGIFKMQENVDKARAALSSIAPVEVSQVEYDGDMLSRVRVGPFPDKKAARAALGKVTKAGYGGAKIVN